MNILNLITLVELGLPDAKYPMWIIAAWMIFNLAEKYVPFFSELLGKKNCEQRVKELEQRDEINKQRIKELIKSNQLIEKELFILRSEHEIILNRLDVVINMHPDNNILFHIMPNKKSESDESKP